MDRDDIRDKELDIILYSARDDALHGTQRSRGWWTSSFTRMACADAPPRLPNTDKQSAVHIIMCTR